MHYALLIYQQEGLFEGLSPEQREDILKQHHQLQADSQSTGSFAGATKLAPAATAVTVNKQGSSVTVTDGPFAETREVLAGFYVFECETLDEAIGYARRIPHIQSGKIEIRPIGYTNTPALQLDA